MRKLLLPAAVCVALLFCLPPSPAQGTRPGATKKYGPGAPKSDPKKSYGSGTPKVDPPKSESKKSYGSGAGKQVTPPATGPPSNVGRKPGAAAYDSKAAAAQKKEESKAKYVQSQKPASTYTDPKGQVHKIDERDVKIAQLRSELNAEKWANRDLRERQFYTVYSSRPVVVYHDPYNSFFWYWLLDRSLEDQARWAYNHRYSMDQARYQALLARNAALSARVGQLESQGGPRNPAYVPNGMGDNDLMYNKEYVQAAYNPVPAPVPARHHGGTSALTYILIVVTIVLVTLIGVWLVFLKRWD